MFRVRRDKKIMENETIDHKEHEEKPAHEAGVHHEASAEVTHHEANKEAKPKNKTLVQLKKIFTLKRIIIAIIIIAVVALGFYFKNLLIAATVNGTVISRLEVIKELEKGSGKAALDSMINERLINLEADNKKITVSDEEIKAEFDEIDKQLAAQGTTLDAALAEQNLTRADISKRIVTQKKLEKMLADKLTVTDQEVDSYIKDNAITLPKDKEAEAKTSIKEQISSGKLNDEAKKLVDELKAKANIKHFVSY